MGGEERGGGVQGSPQHIHLYILSSSQIYVQVVSGQYQRTRRLKGFDKFIVLLVLSGESSAGVAVMVNTATGRLQSHQSDRGKGTCKILKSRLGLARRLSSSNILLRKVLWYGQTTKTQREEGHFNSIKFLL